jgi:hypothetical protein
MLQETIKKNKQETSMEDAHDHEYGKIKKIRACPYYSPFKASCVNHNHPGYDEEYSNKYPRCNLRGKYSECKIVDKVIELTLDEYNSVIHREYLYIKGRVNLAELEDNLKEDAYG